MLSNGFYFAYNGSDNYFYASNKRADYLEKQRNHIEDSMKNLFYEVK